MSTTLFGKLYSDATFEYEKTLTALEQNKDLVNRFGIATTELELAQHAVPKADGSIALRAISQRGHNHETLFAKLAMQGYQIGEPTRTPNQFTDGYVMWAVMVKGNKLEFMLLYYTEVEVA